MRQVLATAVGTALVGALGMTHLAGQTPTSPTSTSSASSASSYVTPPRAIVDILDAAPFPNAMVSPALDRVVLLERRSMPTIRELAQPMFRLAGERMNPRNYAPHRSMNIVAVTSVSVADGAQTRVSLPPDTTGRPIGFSPDGRAFAYAVVGEDRVALWLLDIASGRARELTPSPLNATLAAFTPLCEWAPSSTRLLCRFATDVPSRPPAPPSVPTGPSVQENAGTATPAPTYQDLLKNDADEAAFEYLARTQLGWVDVANGTRTPIGPPALVETFSIAPNGQFILVSQLARPFSRTVPYDHFAKAIDVWSAQGAPAASIAKLPVADNVPIGGVPTGRRAVRWNRFAPATVVWVEALDGGDTRRDARERDRVLSFDAPFTGTPREMARTGYRFQSLSWTEQGVALLTESDRKSRMTRTWAIDDEGAAPRKLWERNADDAYANPGTPLARPGRGVVAQDGDRLFLAGEGSSPQGDLPFLARLDLRAGSSDKIFRTADGSYEQVVALLSNDASVVLTRYESKTDPPNYAVRNTNTNTRRLLTQFKDPAPQMAGIEKQRLTYTRKDGTPLTATLYLPPGHTAGQKHPLLLWAYPREFGDAATAGQVRGSLHRFTTVAGASHLLLLTQGYAILDDPTMPIVGAGDTANDTYVEQLVSSAEAAVDTVIALGVTDRDRIGVGGHSYGAFMTANLLAHSDLFRAGIARSGAYNRTLTPFGFQNEQRTFWEVPEIYARMSPFWNAHRIKEPVLLIHGEADDNTGTYPVQSERFYAALKGHGATVRYVTLPHEAHGYAARESVLHTVAEMLAWMDTHVKNAAPRTTPTASGRP